MRVIGLTGGIATGKSTVSALFAAQGLPVVDADIIAKQIVEKVQRQLQPVPWPGAALNTTEQPCASAHDVPETMLAGPMGILSRGERVRQGDIAG